MSKTIIPGRFAWMRPFGDIVHRHGAFFVLMIFAGIVGAVPVFLSIFEPNLNNPVVIAICASGQFFISIFAGIAWSKDEAIKEANLRWVPMAASACDRLATILGSVANLRTTVGQACAAASKNLPELANDTNRAIRVHFEGLCNSNATRLNDVESHLDSALTDWERFIKHNCSGPECADIGRRLAVLRARLKTLETESGSACAALAPPVAQAITAPATDDNLELMVNGVTATRAANGRWPLKKIEDGFWECEKYVLRREDHGWYVEDRADSDSYFFRPRASSHCGVYERCEVCPYDGTAVVYRPFSPEAAGGPAGGAQANTQPPPRGATSAQSVLNWAIALCPSLQHAIQCHCLTPEKIAAAVTQSSNLREYLAMLGIQCPQVVSTNAIPTLNAIRQSIGREVFRFDPALFSKLCAQSKKQTVRADPQAKESTSSIITDSKSGPKQPLLRAAGSAATAPTSPIVPLVKDDEAPDKTGT